MKVKVFLTFAALFLMFASFYWLASGKAGQVGAIPGLFGLVIVFIVLSLVWERRG